MKLGVCLQLAIGDCKRWMAAHGADARLRWVGVVLRRKSRVRCVCTLEREIETT